MLNTVLPEQCREDTAWVYDNKSSSLLVFGGWANRWLGDLVKLNVSSIIGPPYACTSEYFPLGPLHHQSTYSVLCSGVCIDIECVILQLTGPAASILLVLLSVCGWVLYLLPHHACSLFPCCPGISPDAGAVFGGTEVTIKGLRFKGGKVQVKFGTTEKNEVVVDADCVDEYTIRCKAPNYEQFGAMPVDVKVSINGEGWTVNKIRYSYFANTAARNCLAFGPGLLPSGISGVNMPFLIQARDTLNEPRTSGGDQFAVKVVSADGKVEGAVRVDDWGDGKYLVNFSVPLPGKYSVSVLYAELGGQELVHIRGSPFNIECVDAWSRHRVVGAVPARRKGATMVGMGDELVLYGGDNSGITVCSVSSGDWKWTTATVSGASVPADRSQHSAMAVKDSMLVFGGSSLADGTELADLYWLKKQPDGSWTWSAPQSHTPYVRCVCTHSSMAVWRQHAAASGQHVPFFECGMMSTPLHRVICLRTVQTSGFSQLQIACCRCARRVAVWRHSCMLLFLLQAHGRRGR